MDFRRDHNEAGLSQVHYVLAYINFRAGHMTELATTAHCGLVHAKRSGDLRERLGAPWWVVISTIEGPEPVRVGIRACEDLVDVYGLEHPVALAGLGHLRAMAGETDGGRERVSPRGPGASRTNPASQGSPVPRGVPPAGVELLVGNPAAAERALRAAFLPSCSTWPAAT